MKSNLLMFLILYSFVESSIFLIFFRLYYSQQRMYCTCSDFYENIYCNENIFECALLFGIKTVVIINTALMQLLIF